MVYKKESNFGFVKIVGVCNLEITFYKFKIFYFLNLFKGSSWGLNGYIYIVRGQNLCGIADYAFLPL